MTCICGLDHSNQPGYVCPFALKAARDELIITDPKESVSNYNQIMKAIRKRWDWDK